jgi:hypothetical protein
VDKHGRHECPGTNWKPGDVVQIDPAWDDVFGGCFMIITEVKSFGAQGYIPAPDGSAYLRVNFENAEKIGRSQWRVDS